MRPEPARVPSLRKLELAAEAKAREFARVRLQQKLQEIADQHGEVSPTAGVGWCIDAGVIELQVLHGQDPGDGHGGCPMREQWGLTCHQPLSLALEDKLAFTVTATASFVDATALADGLGAGGVGVSAEAMPVRTAGTVLDSPRSAAAQCADRSPAQSPLEPTLAPRLIRG